MANSTKGLWGFFCGNLLNFTSSAAFMTATIFRLIFGSNKKLAYPEVRWLGSQPQLANIHVHSAATNSRKRRSHSAANI